MSNKIIYSFKANGNGFCISGRVCAENMVDATNQVAEILEGYPQANVNINELKNQTRAMKEWLSE